MSTQTSFTGQKQNIVKVLKQAQSRSAQNNYNGLRIIIDKKDIEQSIKFFNKTLNKKIEYFSNLDKDSYTYKFIHSKAKRALSQLRETKQTYNFEVYDLVNVFLNIEDIHNKPLKYEKHEIIEPFSNKKPRVEIKQELKLTPAKEGYLYLREGETLKRKLAKQKQPKKLDLLDDEFSLDDEFDSLNIDDL